MERVWGIRTGRAAEILNKLKQHMQEHPDNFYGDVDTLLELIYFHYTEYNPVETPEFKAVINPLEKTLRSLVETDEEADQYMNIVFELCCAYERQAYGVMHEYATRAISVEPDNPSIIYWLIVALRKYGAADMAKEHLESAKIRLLAEEYQELEGRLMAV